MADNTIFSILIEVSHLLNNIRDCDEHISLASELQSPNACLYRGKVIIVQRLLLKSLIWFKENEHVFEAK